MRMESGFYQAGGESTTLRLIRYVLANAILVLPWLGPPNSLAQSLPFTVASISEYRLDRILVMPKRGLNLAVLASFHAVQNTAVLGNFPRIGGLQVLRVTAGENVNSLIAKYER